MRYSMKTDKGIVRSSNQDNCYVTVFDENSCFGVVCDGMGGPKAGDVASQLAIREISDRFIEGWKNDISIDEAKQLLGKAVKTANLKILGLSSSNADYSGMGTTVVAAVCIGNQLLIANVGDSRAYLLGDEIIQLSKDHSLVQELIDKGELSEEQAESFPHRNIITRALGISSSVEIDYFTSELNNNCILLCSDGLYNFVSVGEIFNTVNLQINDFENTAEKLISVANANGGGDNITAVLIKR